MPNLVGTGLNQVPTNSMLGGLAYQNPEHASIKNLDLKNLSQINSEIADTAVDVFVYDTSKDSDGGAWRKRTQHTSWYNETLGTATRGTRREFPAVAVIAYGSGFINIYDGDDPDLPMWMTFDGGNFQTFVTDIPTSISMLNGILVWACKHTTSVFAQNNLVICNFISEKTERISHAGNNFSGTDRTGIVNRNVWNNSGTWIGDRPLSLVNYYINDVAMTVLPNAPIDDTTGLPIPTIAVATNGGVSVIKDDGSVVDLNVANRPYSSVDFTTDNLIFAVENPGTVNYDLLRYFQIPSADITTANSYGPSSSPALFPTNTKGNIFDSFTYGSPVGLSIIDHADGTSPATSGMIAYLTSNYNTGWMHGDCKGVFLSDTYTGADFGSDLVTGGNFSNASDWTLGTGWSINGSGQAVHSGSAGYITQSGSFTQGKYYQLTADLVSGGSAGNLGIVNHHDTSVTQPHNNSSYTDVYCVGGGKIYAMWKQSGVNLTSINLYANNSGTMIIDNVSIKEITRFYYDRSVNNKPLASIGTITKSAVATGADLVAYSGFSASNYLQQPYNSDLNYGTGTYYFMYWLNSPVDGADRSVFCQGDYATARGMYTLAHNSSGTGNQLLVGDGVGTVTIQNHENQGWVQICLVRSNGTLSGYRNGVLQGTASSTLNISSSINTSVVFGAMVSNGSIGFPYQGKLSLFRTGASAPTAEQIKKMYNDEKHLFEENSKATLYGSSDAVTALAFDDTTNLLHVGTSSGRSEFQGLRRINNTTDAVTTAISASNGLVAEQ